MPFHRRSPDEIAAHVRAFLRQHLPATEAPTLVVAVSGGPDSMALLDVTALVAPDLGVSLHVAHLDHGLRDDAAADAEFVAVRAAAYGLSATIGRVEPNELDGASNVEARARDARYRFLSEVVERVGAQGVAVGHTAQDQAETFLLRLLRGAGPAGLRGMLPVRELRLPGRPALRVLRPLLDLLPEELGAYRAARNVPARRDPSNDDLRYARNRVRHRVLPALRAVQPESVRTINRTAGLLADAQAFLDGEADAAFARFARLEGSAVWFDRAALRALGLPLRRTVLRVGYGRLRGGLEGLELIHLDAALRLLETSGLGGVDWPAGLRVEVSRDALRIGPPVSAPTLRDEPISLAVPGVTRLPGVGAEIVARVLSDACGEPASRGHVDFDLDRTGDRLEARRRRPGDRLRPAGVGGTKKVQDLLVDAKVPRSERDAVPIVAGSDGIVWVAGVRADERYLATPSTQRTLCLRCRRLESEHAP